MSHKMSSDVCGTSYCVTLLTTHAQYKNMNFIDLLSERVKKHLVEFVTYWLSNRALAYGK